MIELFNLLSMILPYAFSIPLSLYIGSIMENIKNYRYYNKRIIQKKKNDDVDIIKDDNNIKDKKTKTNTLKFTQENNNINEINMDIINEANIPKSFKQCFVLRLSNLQHPSKLYTYYARFSLYIIFLIIILVISKLNIPELLEIFTLKFWMPSKTTMKGSFVGFIISIIFGKPWLDNPFLQMYTLNKYLRFQNSYNKSNSKKNVSYKSTKKQKIMKEENDEFSLISSPTKKHRRSKHGNLAWNPVLHFNNSKKALFIDISRLICSSLIVPVIEELMFRYIFYRFFIGGFNYKFVSFNTWKWSAAILSNIAITHFFYIRCYEKGEEWITGLINGYICTYSMVKQGKWNASVNTHFLINFYIGLFVILTKKYKYWR